MRAGRVSPRQFPDAVDGVADETPGQQV